MNGYFTNYKKNHTPEKPKIRAILNLKPINKSVRKVKFRMKTLNVVRQFLQKDHFMVFIDVGLSIGLENTSSTNLFYFSCEMRYFHIGVFPSHQKYLRFYFLKENFMNIKFCLLVWRLPRDILLKLLISPIHIWGKSLKYRFKYVG